MTEGDDARIADGLWGLAQSGAFDAAGRTPTIPDRLYHPLDAMMGGGRWWDYPQAVSDAISVAHETGSMVDGAFMAQWRITVGDLDLARRMFVDTIGGNGYEGLFPDERSFAEESSAGVVMVVQPVVRKWLAHPESESDASNRSTGHSARGLVKTMDVYRAFDGLFENPAGEIIAIGGFPEAADIMFAATHLRLRSIRMTRGEFIRTAVAAAKDGDGELDWLLRLSLRITDADGLALPFPLDIDYVRENRGLPMDFIVESARSRGVGVDKCNSAFDALASRWNDIIGSVARNGRPICRTGTSMLMGMLGISGSKELFAPLGYDDRKHAMNVMHALSEMPDDVPRIIAAVGASTPEFEYQVNALGVRRWSNRHNALSLAEEMLSDGDSNRLYHWLVASLECSEVFGVFDVIIRNGPDGDFLEEYSLDRVSASAIQSMFANDITDICGHGRGHANRRPPKEVMTYVEGGAWPETLTYGRDILIIPDAIRTAFAERVPDDYHNLMDIMDSDRRGDGDAGGLQRRVWTHPALRELRESLF